MEEGRTKICLVSMVVDQYQKQWTQPFQQWQSRDVTDFSEVLRKLGKLDERLGAKDCVDAKKDELIKKLEERIKELEVKPEWPEEAIKSKIRMAMEQLFISVAGLQDDKGKRIHVPNHITINLVKEVLNKLLIA